MNKKITSNLLLRTFNSISLILLLVLSTAVHATNNLTLTAPLQPITGVVTDENNDALPGVTVRVKNSTNATSTDVKGRYTINAEKGAVLVFSFVGYLNQEVTVGDGILNVKMKPQYNMLNEVVAIGYQTMRKSDVTGAVSSVKASELNLAAPTLGQALVGKVAGVQVSQTSGAPYQSTKIRVRGIGSFNASSDPLYVIDGYPANNDVYINPDDVESVDILKDAASAAIYGSRASGGVVLITTKRGKNKKGQFEYHVQMGVDQLAKKVDLLNADEFGQLVIDGRNNAYYDLWTNAGGTWNDAMYSDTNSVRVSKLSSRGISAASSVQIPDYLYDFANQKLIHQTVNTDWQDELYRNAFFQKHTLSFSGGNDATRYYVSGGYQNQEGIIVSSGQERYNFRSNIESDISKKLHVDANVSYTSNYNHEIQEGRFDHGPILGALIYMPFFPAYNADGSLATNAAASQSSAYGFQSVENPVALAIRTKITRKGYRTTINGAASYKILDNLVFKARVGANTYNEKYDYYLPTTLSSGANPPGSPQAIAAATATAQSTTITDQLAEFTLNYNKQIGKHRIDALGGYTIQKNMSDVISITGKGFQNDNIPEVTGKGAEAGFLTLNDATGKSNFTLLSYFGRVGYNYAGKYFLTGSFRADGSSRFGPQNRYGYFPSVAAGWTLSEEPFYHDFLGEQSTVKLRASWGLSGNYNIGNYSYLQTLASPTGVVFGSTSAVATATYANGITDEKLGWETTSQYNFGADIGLFKGRLSVIANYYLSYSSDLLYRQPISAISGATTILTNLRNSEIRNKGFDFQLDGRVINARDFNLNLTGNISINRNKVTKLSGNNTIIINGAERSYLTNITQQGQPVGMFYGFKVAGMVTPENINSVAPSASQSNPLHVGDLYFVDTNGDGIVNDADKTVIGNPYPDFTYGFAVSLNYKKIDFSASFNGSQGNDVLDGQDYYLYNMEGSGNNYADVVNRYRNAQQTGDGSVYRASRAGTQSNSTRLSTFYLQNGSFLRCNNITLGYTLPKSLVSKIGMSNLRIYSSVVNAFTITKYKGYNPEVDYNFSSGASNSVQPANLAPGVDYGVYPLVRSFNLGIRAAF
ncbi:TonB-dependent receptor [Mucilaginibacter pallidiroseus]|uniref:TonB-dependent receptor n=1 Tax=Mucilaginibacter pallidiroseus TaxID=2599295 RepID=A0A563TZD4_9SPHI|nr:TonB-dependent receptor [Mucilaginibacter pallidiroseus]TWR24734.1 TonB-dependent receptor [Mucilaginibacter pallidiroseus]